MTLTDRPPGPEIHRPGSGGPASGRPIRTVIWSAVWAWGLVALSKSWRLTTEGLDTLDGHLEKGPPVIIVFWHSHYVTLFPLLRGRRACVFTSRSPRGSILAGIAERFGMNPVQIGHGSESRSYATMREAIEGGASAAIAVDGPLGPYHYVHAGAVRLASDLRHLILPVAAASRGRVELRRWDRLEVPHPFTSVALVAGPPFAVPPALADADVHTWTHAVHEKIDAASGRAVDLVH